MLHRFATPSQSFRLPSPADVRALAEEERVRKPSVHRSHATLTRASRRLRPALVPAVRAADRGAGREAAPRDFL